MSDVWDTGKDDVTPITAGAVKIGQFLVINGRPCKVTDVSHVKTGKHGAAKSSFIGVDIFRDEKWEMVCPSAATVSRPIIEMKKCHVSGISDGYVSLTDDGGNMRDDLQLPDDPDIAQQLKDRVERGVESMVTVLCGMGEEHQKKSMEQAHATSPPFLCNLHLGRFVRLHKKGGLVAYA